MDTECPGQLSPVVSETETETLIKMEGLHHRPTKQANSGPTYVLLIGLAFNCGGILLLPEASQAHKGVSLIFKATAHVVLCPDRPQRDRRAQGRSACGN